MATRRDVEFKSEGTTVRGWLYVGKEGERRPTIVLERGPETPHEPESVVDAPLVGFDAFTTDHRVFGWVRLSADRLTDLLNAHQDIELVNAQVEGFADGQTDLIDGLVSAIRVMSAAITKS